MLGAAPVLPKALLMIAFRSIARATAWRIAGSDIGQPTPRSLIEEETEQVSSDQFGRSASYVRDGRVDTCSPSSTNFGRSRSVNPVAMSTACAL